MNWGVRADGSLVLFDWELFGPGVPAIDLAVSVPGLGDKRAYALVAKAYLEARAALVGASDDLPTADGLARMLAVAKAASVVQLCYASINGSAHVQRDLLDWLRDSFPAWVTAVEGDQ
jgi:hypothetical protein